EGVEYAVDALVVSNGRLYKVVVGGTLDEGELGGGLHGHDLEDSTESNDETDTETLGSLTFEFVSNRTSCRWRMNPYPYKHRADLAYGSRCETCCPSCTNVWDSCSCINICSDNCGNPITCDDVITQTTRGPFFYSIDPQGRYMY